MALWLPEYARLSKPLPLFCPVGKSCYGLSSLFNLSSFRPAGFRFPECLRFLVAVDGARQHYLMSVDCVCVQLERNMVGYVEERDAELQDRRRRISEAVSVLQDRVDTMEAR